MTKVQNILKKQRVLDKVCCCEGKTKSTESEFELGSASVRCRIDSRGSRRDRRTGESGVVASSDSGR